ncbi:MAG: hypothetical protein JXQ96_17645 [Cyclobacteriaceae bacterium]
MTELEEKQRKRRFWVYVMVFIITAVACFWSGYKTGKVYCEYGISPPSGKVASE